MASQNRLTATPNGKTREQLTQLEQDHDLGKTEAELVAARAGLRALGYDTPEPHPTPEDNADRLLYYVKHIGMILGVTGLTTVGYGIFGDPLFRIWGFGLLLAGFLLIATEAFLREYSNKNDADTPDLTVEEVLRG